MKGDKRNGLCGYCKRGLAASSLADGRTHYHCPVDCKPWMRNVPPPLAPGELALFRVGADGRIGSA